MVLKNRVTKNIILLLIINAFILIIFLPEVCTFGAQKGLIISANVIIPSLFPFMVFVSMLLKMDFLYQKKSKKTKTRNSVGLYVMVLSMLGGYPIGAKIINDLYHRKIITKKSAHIMQIYCVNAGPAFITVAIGNGIFSSKNIGYLLLISHIAASFIIAAFTMIFLKNEDLISSNNKTTSFNASESFVISTSEAASSIINICSFVVLFSVINSYLVYFSEKLPILKYISYFTEVTTAVTLTKNIYFISFLLGFSGISIWFQIFSLSKSCGVNFIYFIIGRFLHAGISSIISYILIKLTKTNISTFSNSIKTENYFFVSNIELTISLAATITLFLIFIYSKNHSRKIIDDVI